MELPTSALTYFIVILVVAVIIFIVLGTGRRRLKGWLNGAGIGVESSNDEVGTNTTTITGVTITNSKSTTVKAVNPGAHVSDTRVEGSEGATVQAGEEK